jgi:chemotaxis response regulator CheB
VRVAIVHASATIARVLEGAIRATPGWRVAWVAATGRDAIARCASDPPDVLVCHASLPDLPADELTRRVLQGGRRAILLLTSASTSNAGDVFEALSAGALDAVAEPAVGAGGDLAGLDEVLRRVRIVGRLGGAGVAAPAAAPARARFPAPSGSDDPVAVTTPPPEPARSSGDFPSEARALAARTPLVVVGASTGGPEAVATVLAAFPRDFAGSIVVVQHLDEQFTGNLLEIWTRAARLPVRPAAEGEFPPSGAIVVTGCDDDLVMRSDGRLAYREPAAGLFYHPSVDVFFASVAAHWPAAGVAALLTGIGRDGAQGLLALRKAGWHTVAQDEASSAVYGMPKAAAEAGAACQVLDVVAIGPALVAHSRGVRPRR